MTDPSIVIPPIVEMPPAHGQDRTKPPPVIEGSIQHKVGSAFFKDMIERQLGEALYRASHIDEPTAPPLAMPLPPPPSAANMAPTPPAQLVRPPAATPKARPHPAAIRPPANPPVRQR